MAEATASLGAAGKSVLEMRFTMTRVSDEARIENAKCSSRIYADLWEN
jgi:hypothetical protein